jgi:hypothetical protein
MIFASLVLISILATLIAFMLGTLVLDAFSAIRSTAARRGLPCGCVVLRQRMPVCARPTRGGDSP